MSTRREEVVPYAQVIFEALEVFWETLEKVKETIVVDFDDKRVYISVNALQKKIAIHFSNGTSEIFERKDFS